MTPPPDPAAPSTLSENGPDGGMSSRHAAYLSRRDSGSSASSRRRPRRRPHRKPVKADPGLAKKSQFLTHLLKHLDLLVYAEIATLYYMECVQPRDRPNRTDFSIR